MPSDALLGSFDQLPDFVDAANRLGAVVLKPSQFVWAIAEKFGETWTMTRSFLDSCIARRGTFLLLTPPIAAIRGTSYSQELQYLRSKGVSESSFRLARWEPKQPTSFGTANRLGWNTFLARKHRQQLTQAIRQDLSILFAEDRAKIVSDDGTPLVPKFDYAFVTVAVDDILLCVVRGRGDLSISIATQERPHDFCELSLLLMILSSSNDNASRPSYVTLSDAARLLRKEMDHLREGLSDERAARTREKLHQFHSIPLAEQLRAVD